LEDFPRLPRQHGVVNRIHARVFGFTFHDDATS
jgi:hypothetical protein